jgi:hydrophobic/amphiphilic exporter-1 (mainly G- bacteria), HAE1 family
MMTAIIERPVATAMIYLAVLALGVFSYLNTPLELAPKEDFPQMDIVTSWPGVPPEIIQTRLTAPLEEAVIAVKGVRKVTSVSELGSSRITVELDPRAELEFTNLALREEIAKAGRTLPYGVRPWLEPYVPDDFRVRPFLSYTISADIRLQKLREMVKDRLEFGLGSVKGVARVTVTGGSDPELQVVLDGPMLKAYDIQPSEIYSELSQRLRAFPTGTVRKGKQEFSLRIPGLIDGPRELGETVVAHTGANVLRLDDLARIEPSYGDIYAINRINGRPTVSLTVYKEKGANTLETAEAVKERLAAVRRELPRDLTFKTVDDESLEIRKKLKDVYLLAGIIMAVVFLMVFIVLRDLKPSLLILSSVAFSVVITFNLIYAFKIAMNMLTLGALALGFGMFVDNSIVVFENILRLRERGVPPRRAALQGPREVFTAVLASTLTTVSVFFSFPYFQGRLRIYYFPLAIVMVSALSASLVVSYTLIPSLSLALIKRTRPAGTRKPGAGFERFLHFIIRHPVGVLLLAGAIFTGSYKWFKKDVTIGEFPRWYSREMLYVSLGLPPGTDIEKTDGVIRKFEDKVLEADYAKEMNTLIFPERAYATISFPPEVERSFRPYALKEQLIQLATQFAGIDCGIYGFDPQGYTSSMGAGTFYDSSIKFTGYNLKKLKEITSELARTLVRDPRIRDCRVFSSRRGRWRTESFEYVLKIDHRALREYDVSAEALYHHFQSLIAGRLTAPLRGTIGGRETALIIKFPETDLLDIKRLQDSLFKTADGEYLRLKDVSRLEEWPIAGAIDRESQQYQQTLSWEFRGPSKAARDYKKALSASLRLPPGFSATLDEPWRMTTDENSEIRFAIIFSLTLIFMILAALYESFVQPFFIMFSVPLGLIGVFAAFIVTGASFDASAYIGVILLGGIVVNNAILLVDHINLKRRQGADLLEAVLSGTRDRVRPLLMTTSTTVFGILPMLFIKAGAGRREIWSSLALCTAGGLVSSTILILIVVPIFYFYGDRLKPWFARQLAEAGSGWRR